MGILRILDEIFENMHKNDEISMVEYKPISARSMYYLNYYFQ